MLTCTLAGPGLPELGRAAHVRHGALARQGAEPSYPMQFQTWSALCWRGLSADPWCAGLIRLRRRGRLAGFPRSLVRETRGAEQTS
eukprot:1184102-Rhodomonas_salina.1